MAKGELTEARKRANLKWDAANLKRMSLAMPMADYEKMRHYLEGRDESQNGFINRAIREAIARDAQAEAKPGDESEGV